MKNERILAFSLAQKLDASDLREVSAAGMTATPSGSGTGRSGAWDFNVDYTFDF